MEDGSTEKDERKLVSLKPISLKRGDSGYLSPVATGSTPEHLMPSRSNSFPLLGDGNRSRTVPTTTTSGTETMQNNSNAIGPGSSSSLDDRNIFDSWTNPDMKILQLAFKCREDNRQAWENCIHPYCHQIRTIWNHWQSCYGGANVCQTCRNFEDLSCRHSGCLGETCPIQSCRSGKKRLQLSQYTACNKSGGVSASGSSDNADIVGPTVGPHPLPERTTRYSNGNLSQEFCHSLHQFETGGLSDDSPAAKRIGDIAEKIVKQLDEEHPLLPENYNSMPGNSVLGGGQERSHSILGPGTDMTHYQLTSLYPIVERQEDILSPSYGDPHSLYNLAFHSHSGPMSSELDGVVMGNVSMNGMPSTGANSLGGEEDSATIYPHQTLMFNFIKDSLTVGSDSHYYQRRDYNANDTPLGVGGFGSILYCKDLTSNQLFAIKHNNRKDESIIDSIHTEASLLSRLGLHNNVIQMYGAVIDEQESEFQPTKVYKMMMELAEHGNLSSLLVDPDCGDPMPLCREQALYYFWQLLEGVRFLHDNNVLHLDIKGLNLLVFDQGKTLKLCDFGTAVRMDEIASSIGKNLCTPQFAAPEICKQKQPRFSSDIWSCMCVLVEMLTAGKPWQQMIREDTNNHSIIFMVGSYKDEDMETKLVPHMETEPITPDLLDLMRLVFKADHTQRRTALELLQHPLVVEAFKYESEFDEAYDCEDLDETEPPLPIPTSCPIPDSGAMFVQNSSTQSSKDNGTGIDLEQEAYQGSYGRTTSSGRNSDSGVDSPCTDKNKFPFIPCPEESSKDLTAIHRGGVCDDLPLHHHNILTSSPNVNGGNFYSLPNPVSSRNDHVVPVQRSFSIACPGSLTTNTIYSSSPPCGSNHGNWIMMHQCSCSTLSASSSLCTLLKHSNSAPAFGSNHRRRRLSLQTMKSYSSDSGMCVDVGQGDGRLRRSSSEVYAVKGPDIDSPKGISKLLGQEVADSHHQAQNETSSPAAAVENLPLLVPIETDSLTATKPQQPVPTTSSSAGTKPTSFKDTPISSETTSIPSENSCSSFEATFTHPEALPINESTPLDSDQHNSTDVSNVREPNGHDGYQVEGMGRFKRVTKVVETHGIKNTFYETIC